MAGRLLPCDEQALLTYRHRHRLLRPDHRHQQKRQGVPIGALAVYHPLFLQPEQSGLIDLSLFYQYNLNSNRIEHHVFFAQRSLLQLISAFQ